MFLQPPKDSTENGANRKVGIEIEFTGVSLERVSRCIQNCFGGVKKEKNKYCHVIHNSELGEFRVELDFQLLQELAEKLKHEKEGISRDFISLQDKVLKTISDEFCPTEVVCPPVRIDQLARIEHLRELLREQGAQGTAESFYYAFGLHINAEVVAKTSGYILSILRAFSLLFDWLKRKGEFDFSRKVSFFAAGYPLEYINMILKESYNPSLRVLITDYIKFNPDRNKALDLLPLFMYLEEKLVQDYVEDDRLIKSRPTFHYRLPNCNISEPDWTIAKEWNLWVKIEELAADQEKLRFYADKYLQEFASGITLLKRGEWVDFLEKELG